MSFLASLDAAAIWRAVSLIALLWLAIFFGRTLRPNQTPLIERFARVSIPDMSPKFRTYTRRLTGIWCAYFVVAAVASVAANFAPVSTGVFIWLGTIVLFVGEHSLRPLFFPAQKHPGLLQQIRDTWQVWHNR